VAAWHAKIPKAGCQEVPIKALWKNKKMRDLHIILAMAGRGSRFASAGFTTPKPLIKVDGQPMFKKALSSLDDIQAKKHYTIIIRAEHDKEYNLAALLKQQLPEANVVASDEPPTGALRDAYRAKPHLKPDEGIVLLDCDLWFHSQPYYQMVQDSLSGTSDIAGGLLTFEANNPRYSYAEVDKNWMVTRTAEKEVISNRAITGAYYIANTQTFIKAADELLAQPLTDKMPEYYISHIYNVLLKQGSKIKATPVEQFASFGTPEELAANEEKG
jgi:UDP-N-acetylglucosamine diphosphorylase / glucose-1-phosphate thymidylyltransferase / UDP-N-acetylgalactosamine diphosphorylase / glucosamine-1-phosphate N-acetyltransferase / galactosamine-1-phosphate N-acetyltransferase